MEEEGGSVNEDRVRRVSESGGYDGTPAAGDHRAAARADEDSRSRTDDRSTAGADEDAPAAVGGDASRALSERGVRGDCASRRHDEHGSEDWPLLHWSTPLAYKDGQSVRAFTAHRQVAVRFKME
jgi:hypothetical protein